LPLPESGQGLCAEDRELAGAAAFPFPILGIDSDNGSKLINWEPFRWCEQEKPASPTEAAARERFGEFEAKWATKYICSTNAIESLNARYRPSSAAADRR